MKQKPITLRKFIETFPHESCVTKESNIPANFKELDYSQKYDLKDERPFDELQILKVTNDLVFFGLKYNMIRRVGKNFFIETDKNFACYIRITPTKISVKSGSRYTFISENFLRSLCNIDWFKDIDVRILQMFILKPSILHGILTKRIYNEETFYRAIGSKCFGIRNISWRSIKTYLTVVSSMGISIFDLRDFTKNVEESINILAKRENVTLYRDLLMYAVSLNRVVDFKWSQKRIEAEHQKQIEVSLVKEIANKETVPIYSKVIEAPNIKMLNTELEIFKEGASMHHCLYNCYYKRIKDKKYIAFHMSFPEDCTFGFRKNGNDIEFDQIYLKYDRPVQLETRRIAENFMEEHKSLLKELFVESEERPEIGYPWDNSDLVF